MTDDPLIRQLILTRVAKGISFRQLQADSGLANGFTCEVEQGKHSISLTKLRRWAAALGYDVTLTARQPTTEGASDDRTDH